MHEHEQDDEGRQICTTSGEKPSEVRQKQRTEGNAGQHSSYIVLCEEERQKGFVRPYRDRYQHVGALDGCNGYSRPEGVLGGPCLNCGKSQPDHVRKGGCQTVTTMGRALSETYARDPGFYGATFCVHCNAHFPVAEFIWTADGQPVGS